MLRGGGSFGARVIINATFHVAAGPAKEQAMEVFRELDRQLNRSAQIVFGGVKDYGDF